MRLLFAIGVACLLVTWTYTRCLTLPVYIYHLVAYGQMPTEEVQPLIYLTAVYLSVLLCLHYFWLYHICLIAYNCFVKGVQKDTLNVVEATVKTKK